VAARSNHTEVGVYSVEDWLQTYSARTRMTMPNQIARARASVVARPRSEAHTTIRVGFDAKREKTPVYDDHFVGGGLLRTSA
jgi:hypothetical protein